MSSITFDKNLQLHRERRNALTARNDHGIRVATLGGGTGLANLLRGLKKYVRPRDQMTAFPALVESISAIVAVTDDGGSSGRLRKELNMIPPGDIRNCITALSEDDALLPRLFEHRFRSGEGLDGHSLGNLFLSALTSMTGNFAEAVEQCAEILAISGRVYPATNSDVQVEAIMEDGRRVRGETNITASTGRILQIELVPSGARALPQAIEAICAADIITIGPGSLFTSLVPNLLVEDIAQAVSASPAPKVLICNLMTQANETIGLSAADHVRVLHEHARRNFIDYAFVNTRPASKKLKAKYAQSGCDEIKLECGAMESLGLKVVRGDYLEEVDGIARHARDRVVHDLLRLASRTKSMNPMFQTEDAISRVA